MATSSFFYSPSTGLDPNTVDNLLDLLNEKVAAADEDRVVAEQAAQQAVGSASNALVSEQNTASLAQQASTTLSAAQTASNTAISNAATSTTKATEAAASAAAALSSQNAAAASEAAASASQTAAAASATAASASQTSASSSAITAATQASNASNSATDASTSATQAANSASAASTSATNAAASATTANAAATNANVVAVGSNIANVNTVAGISANVTSVAGNATNINTVAGNISNVNAVGAVSANVTTVANSIASVNTTALNIGSIISNQNNMAAIQGASANATAAAASATAAAASAASAATSSFANFQSGGTANGVAYLNGSKVLTTGSALTFDGSQLDIPLGSAAAPSLSTPTDPNTGIFFPAADTIAFAEGGVEAMRLDANGRRMLGTTTPSVVSGYITDTISGVSGSYTEWQQNGSNTFRVGSDTSSGGFLFTQAAVPIRFGTNSLERMRITSSGNLLVGAAAQNAQGRQEITFDGAAAQGLNIIDSGSLATSTAVSFIKSAGTRGTITVTASATAYNTSSDYRLKNITGPVTNSGAYIDSLNPVEGTWKVDGSPFVGLIAHEVQEASRTSIATGVKDGEEMQGMDYSNSELIANLIAEVKSLRARVAALEAN